MKANRKNSAVNQQLTADILAVATQRDKDAFSRLFDHFVPLIRAFSLSSLPGATSSANDIAQEVMLKVWRKADTFNPELATVSTWIFTLARNAKIDYLRRHGKQESDIDPDFVYAELPDTGPGPFQAAQVKRNEDMVRRAMEELPPEQYSAVKIVYLEGKSHSEAAKEMGLPLGTLKSRVRLALKKLSVLISR